jgi:hypothetical protein
LYCQQQYCRLLQNAKYHTEPFNESPYYAWRLAKWSKNRAWEFELVHHKLYLSNPPAEVQHFEVSHGYNLITINRAWLLRGFIWRFGAGLEHEIRLQVQNRLVV